MGHSSSIDDILVNASLPPERRALSPVAPEAKFSEPFQAENDDYESPEPIAAKVDNNVVDILAVKPKFEEKSAFEAQKEQKEVADAPKKEEFENIFDDYGNEQAKPISKTYTEDEVNERINKAVRERLERLERNNPVIQPNQQQNNPVLQPESNNPEDWQKQFEEMTIKAVEKREQQQIAQRQMQQEQKAQREFEEKFHAGMGKFGDFREVVGAQPFTDAMTIATRAMKDPAAFLYAAAKRHAPEIQRISTITDPYTQMVEIGRLEERMRKTQSGTKAPRPMRATREDTTVEEPVRRTPTIEDLMQQADKSRMARMRTRR